MGTCVPRALPCEEGRAVVLCRNRHDEIEAADGFASRAVRLKNEMQRTRHDTAPHGLCPDRVVVARAGRLTRTGTRAPNSRSAS